MSEKLPRALVLRKRADFSRVRREGRRAAGVFLLLNWLSGDDEGERRVGVIVTKALGIAVTRNRVKRRVREAYRKIQGKLKGGVVSVWVVRQKAAGASYEDLRNEMEKIYRKEKLFVQKED